MRHFPLWIVTVAACALPVVASAHTGGALDADGCHPDHRTGTYHCHRGAAAGYTFPNRDAMLEAVRTGKYPEKSVDEDGFFSKIWPWGSKHQDQKEAEEEETKGEPVQPLPPGEKPAVIAPAPVAPAPAAPAAKHGEPLPPEENLAPAAPAPSAAPAASAATGASAAATAPAGPQNEYERRLKVLQGLYEMGLITKEEYETKRKEVLGQL
jgi:hypothetical protein